MEEVGEGFYGLVTVDPSDASKAVKTVAFSPSENVYFEPWVLRELYALCLPPHPHLLRMDRLLSLDAQTCRVLMPRALCDLESKLDRLGLDLTLKQVGSIFLQLFSALETLHGYGLIHYDIKPDNILVFSWPCPEIKLADFGLVLFRHAPVYPKPEFLVAPLYRPPEHFLDYSKTKKRFQLDFSADVYSAGIVMLQLLAAWAARGNVEPTFADTTSMIPEKLSIHFPHLWKLKKSRRCKKRAAVPLWKNLFTIATKAASLDRTRRPTAGWIKMEIARVLKTESPNIPRVKSWSCLGTLSKLVDKEKEEKDKKEDKLLLTSEEAKRHQLLLEKIPKLVDDNKVPEPLKRAAFLALKAWIPHNEQSEVLDWVYKDMQLLENLVLFYNWLLQCQ